MVIEEGEGTFLSLVEDVIPKMTNQNHQSDKGPFLSFGTSDAFLDILCMYEERHEMTILHKTGTLRLASCALVGQCKMQVDSKTAQRSKTCNGK